MVLATFSGGNFWIHEAAFQQIKGVVATRVGYTGGKEENPTHMDVCNGKSDHVEAVQINYEPEEVNFQQLLDIFFSNTKNSTEEDYTAVIYYHTNEQKQQAEEYLTSKKQNRNTKLESAGKFWQAEEHHQSYYMKMAQRYSDRQELTE